MQEHGLKGQPKSEATKEKMRLAKLGKKISNTHRSNISVSKKGAKRIAKEDGSWIFVKEIL